MKISAVLITLNEERNIERALRSVSWADEVLVVDSGSTDRTCEIAEGLGAKVLHHDWNGFSEQKQFATNAASNDWVFSLDADEWISDALRDEILILDKAPTSAVSYTMPRLTTYLRREIRHSGWYPDRQLRLFDRTRSKWNGRLIHESVVSVDGSRPGRLSGCIFHKTVDGVMEHARVIATRYAPLSAQQMLLDGKSTSMTRGLASAAAKLIQTYILQLGFLDGIAGVCIAYFAAHHVLLKHLILMDLLRERDSPSEK